MLKKGIDPGTAGPPELLHPQPVAGGGEASCRRSDHAPLPSPDGRDLLRRGRSGVDAGRRRDPSRRLRGRGRHSAGRLHQIRNVGTTVLKFLCCCAPGYEDEDTVLEKDG